MVSMYRAIKVFLAITPTDNNPNNRNKGNKKKRTELRNKATNPSSIPNEGKGWMLNYSRVSNERSRYRMPAIESHILVRSAEIYPWFGMLVFDNFI